MTPLTGTKTSTGVSQRVINEVPPHDVWISAFYGRGTIAKRIRPAAVTIGLDLDDNALTAGRSNGHLMFRADALEWLRDYFMYAGNVATFGGHAVGRHFVFLDPPYLTTIGRGYYAHELTAEQHAELIRLFLDLPCPAIITHPAAGPYIGLKQECRAERYTAQTRNGPATEYMFCNFDPPPELHDSRFIGADRREREVINRRRKRWADGLRRMPPQERAAVFESMAKVMNDV